jgi:hypothetical protein
VLAEKKGAKVILDGRNVAKPKGFEGGNYIGSTVLDNCDVKNPVLYRPIESFFSFLISLSSGLH